MRLKPVNVICTTSPVQLASVECMLAEMLADPANAGTVIVTELEDDNLVVTKLTAGAALRLDMRKSPKGDLNELKVQSTVADDVLIIRPIIKVEEGGT